MKQQTLAMAADQGEGFEQHRRTTRRDVFLSTMERIVPWSELCAVIEPHYPKAGRGRPPVGLKRMLRMYFVQHWFNLADEACEEALVANEVHESESADHASVLITMASLRQRTAGRPLVLHSDNGSAMKGAVMLATLHELGVASSFSRPRVSNDNAVAESLFRTAKYCPLWLARPFDTLDQARLWVNRFVAWYNDEHRHSALKYVTPSQRHLGQADELLVARAALYAKARQEQPARWERETRDWTFANDVYLNPERQPLKTAA